MDWQPIATAPKDGTAILVADGEGIVFIGYWAYVGRYTSSEQMWLGHPYGAMRDGDCEAWMPIPEYQRP